MLRKVLIVVVFVLIALLLDGIVDVNAQATVDTQWGGSYQRPAMEPTKDAVDGSTYEREPVGPPIAPPTDDTVDDEDTKDKPPADDDDTCERPCPTSMVRQATIHKEDTCLSSMI